MSEEKPKQEDLQEIIDRLHKICKKLQDENERLKEKILAFYGK
jgi:hypothetical protein